MMNEDFDIVALVLAALIFFLLGMCIGGCEMQRSATANSQNEAVKHNAAKWVPDESGKPVFKWNDEVSE